MKTNIKRIDSLTHNDTTATKNINDNFAALQAGIEDALSRTGKTPNFMDAELDMNTRRIINVGDAVDDTDAANWGQMRKAVEKAEAAARSAHNDAERAGVSEANAKQYAAEARNSRDRAEQAANDAKQYRDETEEIAEQAKKDIKDLTDSGLKQLGDQIDNGVVLLDETINSGKKELDETINEGLTDINNGKREIEELVKSGEGKIKDATDEGVRKIESAADSYQTVDNMVGEILEGVAPDKYPSSQAVIKYVKEHGGAGSGGAIEIGLQIAALNAEGHTSGEFGWARLYTISLSEYIDPSKTYYPEIMYAATNGNYELIQMSNTAWYLNGTLMLQSGSGLSIYGYVHVKVILHPIESKSDSYDIYIGTNGQYETWLNTGTYDTPKQDLSYGWVENTDSDVPSNYKYKKVFNGLIKFSNSGGTLGYTGTESVDVVFDAMTAASGKVCPAVKAEVVNKERTDVTIYATEPLTEGTAVVRFYLGGRHIW